jgi:hypothetical protein
MINNVEKTYSYFTNEFNGYKMTLDNGTVTFVPLSETNTDYQAIQEWIAEGGVVIDNGGND